MQDLKKLVKNYSQKLLVKSNVFKPMHSEFCHFIRSFGIFEEKLDCGENLEIEAVYNLFCQVNFLEVISCIERFPTCIRFFPPSWFSLKKIFDEIFKHHFQYFWTKMSFLKAFKRSFSWSQFFRFPICFFSCTKRFR